MSKRLYYAPDIDDESCYTRSQLIQDMKDCGLTELKIYRAKPEIIKGMFYCSQLREWGESDGVTCGSRHCEIYSPRNGKNGRCRYHHIYSYEPTEKFHILKLKP